MNVKSGVSTYFAYKSDVLICGIPPPEIVNNLLLMPFRSVICCMPKFGVFSDMPRVMCSCTIMPLIHRSTSERIYCQTMYSAMCALMTNMLSGVNIVTPPILVKIMKSKLLALIFIS